MKKDLKFKKKDQGTVKTLSKVISVLALLGQIGVYIATPCIILCMVIIPIAINKVEISDNSITLDNKYTIDIIEEDEKVTFKHNADVVEITENVKEVKEFKNMLIETSKSKIITFVECIFAITLVSLALSYMVLRHIKKLFDNVHDLDTPFTLENADHMKKAAIFMILAAVVPYVLGGIIELIIGKELGFDLSTVSVIEILFLFCMSYIFKYGCEIQSNSKKKIYGEIEE